MKRISFFLCLLSIVSLSACSKTETPEATTSNAKINIGVSGEAQPIEENQSSMINIQVKESAAQQ